MWTATGLLLITIFGRTVSQECYDTGGVEFCKYILRMKGGKCNDLKPAELSQCMKTCLVGGCKNSGNNRPPSWAVPTRRPSVTRRNEVRQRDDLALPLYAVIIIVVALVVVFIGITVCMLKIKQKWKKRKSAKMARNRDLLRHAPPPSRTLPPSYIWTTGSNNGAYYVEQTENWPRTMQSQPGERNVQNPTVLNNSSGRDRVGAKEINVIQNETKKRQAPNPKEEMIDQSRDVQNLKISTMSRGKGPAPLPPTKNSPNDHASSNDGIVNENGPIPIQRTESPFSDVYKNRQAMQMAAPEERVLRNANPDLSPVRAISLPKEPNVFPDAYHDQRSKHMVDKEYQSDDTMTIFSEGTYSAVTDDTITGPALVSILGEWKDHLQTQRKELAEYYKNLHSYIKHIGLKPRIDQKEGLEESNADFWYQNRDKTNGEGQDRPQAHLQEAIHDLKNRLVCIQTLLDKPQEFDSNNRSAVSSENDNRDFNPLVKSAGSSESRFTIKVLMRRLGERDCLKVQVRIAEALDTARKRKMTVVSRDGPISCLCKQIHNIMTDMLDPRTSTKIELGAHAASTLSSKLLTNIQCNLLPVLQDEGAKFDVSKTSDRIAMLTQQLLDMARQLVSRSGSFQEEDYCVYVKALIDSCEKIMDTTFHLVCTIVDLQMDEKRRLSRNVTHSLPMAMKNEPVKLPRQFTFDNRSKTGYIYASESHSTSHSTLDVKRLNEDISRLRHLLDNGMKLPSLSDVTLPTNRNPEKKMAKTNIPGAPTRKNRVYDDRSSISCSTCMLTDADESQFFEDDLTDMLYPDVNDDQMIAHGGDTILGDEIPREDETPSELYRPATRPRDKPNCFANVIYNEPNDLQLPVIDQQSAQVESSKPSQMKVGGAQPSSFASFRSGHVVTNDIQPRHQAMLGRYFNEEVVQPKENNKYTKNNNNYAKNDDLSPEKEQVDAEPVVNPDLSDPISNSQPHVTGGSPVDNSAPRPSSANLLDIPEITVYRNGTKEHVPSDDDPTNLGPNETLGDTTVPVDPTLPVNPTNPAPNETPGDTTLPVDPSQSTENESSDETGSITSAENILGDYPQDITDSGMIETEVDDSVAIDVESAVKLDYNPDDNNDGGEPTDQAEMRQNNEEIAPHLPADSNETDSLVSEFEFPRAPSATEGDIEISPHPIDAEPQANIDVPE